MNASVGRIVHFVLPLGGAGGQSAGQIRPLIVTQAWSDGQINGKVILDGVNDLGHDEHAYTVPYDEATKMAGTWHWPPRV